VIFARKKLTHKTHAENRTQNWLQNSGPAIIAKDMWLLN